MAVPKKRTSKRRKRMRRSHHALSFNASITECTNCGALKLSHHLCEECGFYRGKQIVQVASEEDSDEASESEDFSVED